MNILARCGITLAASIPLLAGCYTYVPAELDTVPAGGEVRVYLTRSARAALPRDLSSADRRFLTGSIERRGQNDFSVRVPVAGRREAFHNADIRQEVRVSAGQILEVRRRELDGARTGLLVAAAAGTATAVLLRIMDASGTPPRDSGEGEPTKVTRVPVFSIPVR